jgi:DNA polymerase III subunit delta
MIIKSFELNKIDLKSKKYFLLYGENQGHKNEIIKKKFRAEYSENVFHYEENEVIKNEESFFNNILTKSFFENHKLIIISQVTEKILSIIEEIIEKKIDEFTIILNANILEKKSKLRNFFEKNKETICIPFYADNNQTLIQIINEFFRENKIPISQQAMNLIVERSRGDRQNLNGELQKIKNFIKDKKKIEIQDILKLTNLAENYNVSDLIDSCLAKNKKKTINILNENNYSHEDCMLIIRTFLIKSKRLLNLCSDFNNNKNIDEVISSSKPPIFWKDKETVKQQIRSWSYNHAENLIFEINETELLIKKNPNNSINILFDFIIKHATLVNN